MVGMWSMGPEAAALEIGPGYDFDFPADRKGKKNGNSPENRDELVKRRLEHIGHRLMNRASGGSAMMGDPIAAVLGDHEKGRAAGELLGQAYVMAYTLIAANRDKVEKIANVLVDRKELHGDEVVNLLDSVDLIKPEPTSPTTRPGRAMSKLPTAPATPTRAPRSHRCCRHRSR